jgi:hypothetical protein
MRSEPMLEIPVINSASLNEGLRNLIKKRIIEAAQNGRLQCSGALSIASSLGVPAKNVGDVADELQIKISKCQMGCF